MKPTQEQVIAWAREVGIERCDCEPRCHLHFGGMGSLTTLATLAYEAGRAAENEACAALLNANAEQCTPGGSMRGVLRSNVDAIRARMNPLQRMNDSAEANGEQL